MINQPVRELVDLEHIKNQISSGEAELNRLTRLRLAEEYAVSEAIKAQKFHEDETEKAKSEKVALEGDVEALQTQLADAKAVLDSADERRSQLEAAANALEEAKSAHTEQVTATEQAHAAREDVVADKEQAHASAVVALESREAKVLARESRLLAFAEELKQGS